MKVARSTKERIADIKAAASTPKSDLLRLLARLDRDQHRVQRHHRLSRSDIALQQAQHRGFLRHVARDLCHGPGG